ncbi:MAG: glutathione S-transferase family protein [Pseudomonadota bacterium]
MITVWGRATSSNVQKVMWAVGELGLPHERIDVGGPHGGLNDPAFRAINPHGLIPAVRLGDGVTMFESSAIVRTLAARDPARTLWPGGGQAEADAHMWMEWAQLSVSSVITTLFWAVVRTKPAERDKRRIAELTAQVAAGLDAAAKRMGPAPHLVGERLTIADIALGHTLYRWMTMEVDRPENPTIEAYYARLTARPAFATHVMVDYSSLRA